MRKVLRKLGIFIHFSCDNMKTKTPVPVISRHENAFYFAGYNPDTTVKIRFQMPQGAPLFTTSDTRIVNGSAEYSLPVAWRKECRIFIKQKENGTVKTRIIFSGMAGVKRRIKISGLKNADISFFHEPDSLKTLKVLKNPVNPFLVGDFLEFEKRDDESGQYVIVRNVSGEVLFSW